MYSKFSKNSNWCINLPFNARDLNFGHFSIFARLVPCPTFFKLWLSLTIIVFRKIVVTWPQLQRAYYHIIYNLIIYMKKLLDSDWLRAVQFKQNTSAKSVTPECKLHIVILDYDWPKDKRKFTKTMISRKMMTKNFVQKLRMRKNGFKKDLRALSQLRIVYSEL